MIWEKVEKSKILKSFNFSLINNSSFSHNDLSLLNEIKEEFGDNNAGEINHTIKIRIKMDISENSW
jgi:hypothetical protein